MADDYEFPQLRPQSKLEMIYGALYKKEYLHFALEWKGSLLHDLSDMGSRDAWFDKADSNAESGVIGR